MRQLAGFIDRRRRWIVASALVLTTLMAAYGLPVVDRLDPYGASDPGSESVEARGRIERAVGFDPDAGLVALVELGGPVDDPPVERRVEAIANRIFADPGIGWVETWYETRLPGMLSRDRGLTFVVAHFRPSTDKQRELTSQRLLEHFSGDERVKLGGYGPGVAEAKQVAERDLARAQLIAFPLLLLVSFWFFRGVVAALLPLLVGAISVLATLAVLRLMAETVSISVFALNLVTALGLGLAIDYSLLVLSRHREELGGRELPSDALAATLATAGTTVLASSVTVACAMASLIVFPQRFLYSMGIGGAIVSVLACLVALVVLPAVLLLLGERVNALAPRALRGRRVREAQATRSSGWYQLAQWVMRRPVLVASVTALALVALAAPALSARFTAIDATALPTSTSTRQVDDLIERRFDIDRTRPIEIVISDPPPDAMLERYRARLAGLDGVRRVDDAQRINDRTAFVQVMPESNAYSQHSQRLVRQIRSRSRSLDAAVGGQSAGFVDQKSSVAARLPVALAIVCVTMFIALFALTGSVVIPIKTLVMNLLTVGSALGVLVLVFQHGRLEALLGYTSAGALELSQPVLLGALAFGIATDYGVFLIARITEAHDGGAANREAIALGLERTGRIVTAAALLLAIAIGSIATSQLAFIKQLGLGTATAVLIGATVVRALLVPSLMAILGRWNWWPRS